MERIYHRTSFETYKSNMCHRLKRLGDIDFIIYALKSGEIDDYYNKKWFEECFYLLAMVDYLCRINNVPLCTNYNSLRLCKLPTTIYPSSVLMLSSVLNDSSILEQSISNAIPEFMRFNIIEGELRDAV